MANPDLKYPGIEKLQTDRIYLEPLSEKHLEDFHDLWTSEEAVRWATRITMKNLEESRTFLAKILPNAENPDIDKFAIILKDTESNRKLGVEVKNEKGEEKCIGITGTNRKSPQGLETGYCLNSLYWNKGFATEAFKLFLSYYWTLPQRREIKHLVAKTDPENLASARVLEKCGGVKGEVVRLKHTFVKEGEEGFEIEVACWDFGRP